MTFKEYIKCVYANKFLFAGYLAGALAIGSVFLFRGLNDKDTPKSLIALECTIISTLGLYAAGSIAATGGGEDTYDAYKQTKKRIKSKKIEQIANHYVKYRGYGEFVYYCSKKGVELAAKEHGLEDKVKKYYQGIYTDCQIFMYKNK